MESNKLTTPILFLVFNRTASTQLVFEAIRKARPTRLFVAADGPRHDKAGELDECLAVRRIATSVDWDCEVKTLFREENLGCGRGISSAITWFFEHVEEGIILEDDTLPSASFFPYCAELLEYYRNDDRVMSISGTTLPNRLMNEAEHSYFFSNWDHIWGWATWRRAWKYYDYSMKHYPQAVNRGFFESNYTSLYEHYYMEHMFDRSYYKNNDVTWWSAQWGFSRKINSGLVIVPLKNLVINLGLGADATNTKNASQWGFMKLEEMAFPLRHPEFVIHDRVTDEQVFEKYFTTRKSRIKAHIKHICPKWIYSLLKKIANKYFQFALLDEYIPAIVGLL